MTLQQVTNWVRTIGTIKPSEHISNDRWAAMVKRVTRKWREGNR